MTESEWLACTNPEAMLGELYARNTSDRKLWCFASAYCRHIWPHITDTRFRRVVEIGDRFVEGEAGEAEVLDALGMAEGLFGRIIAQVLGDRTDLSFTPGRWGAQMAAFFTRQSETQQQYQCALLREVQGNPFRPVQADPTWLRWNDGCVVQMAQAIYEERQFDQLLMLEDALIDAGCDSQDVLAHCRLPTEHVRGCWVVDLMLAKG